jgi:hypothetical protein
MLPAAAFHTLGCAAKKLNRQQLIPDVLLADHRLKLIKRQMYGRACFQLLRRRVLPYKYDRCFANSYRAP